MIAISLEWMRGRGAWHGPGVAMREIIRSAGSRVGIGEGPGSQASSFPALLLRASRRTGGTDGERLTRPDPGPTRLGVAGPLDDPERDRALMTRLRTRDEEAFAALYDRYAAQVHGVALSILRSPALAEEATHDVFLRLWQQPGAFDPARGTFAGWLLRVARNRAIDVLRRRREESGNGPEGDVTSWIADPAPGPEDEAIDRLRRQVVHEALNALTPDHRMLLELAYFTGLSQSQIAERLGRPLGTVKSQIRAAMARLADRLAASDETRTSEPLRDREGHA